MKINVQKYKQRNVQWFAGYEALVQCDKGRRCQHDIKQPAQFCLIISESL